LFAFKGSNGSARAVANVSEFKSIFPIQVDAPILGIMVHIVLGTVALFEMQKAPPHWQQSLLDVWKQSEVPMNNFQGAVCCPRTYGPCALDRVSLGTNGLIK